MAQITQSQIIFDSSDFFAGNPKVYGVKAVFNPSNQRSLSIDPFRDYGILQPGKKASNATNVAQLGGCVIAGVLKNVTTAYLLDGDGGKVHEFTYSTNTITNGGSFPHTIAGTTPVGQDILAYRHNVGGTANTNRKYSPFYSWYDSTSWGVGCYSDYTTFQDTFSTATATTPLTTADTQDPEQINAPHPLEVGSDDVLYIGSGRYLHAFDGSTGNNGTFSARVLTLPANFFITGLQKFQDKLLIAGVFSNTSGVYTSSAVGSAGEAFIYVWNYVDLDVSQIIPLDDPYVSSIFSWRGSAHVATIGESEGFGAFSGVKIKKIVGNTATKIAEIPTSSDIVYRGIDSSSRVLYLNSAGRVFTLGDNVREGYNLNHITSCPENTLSGWIKNIVTYGLFAGSSDDASTHLISKFGATSTDYVDEASFVTCYYPVPLEPGKVARIKTVHIEYAGVVTDAKAEMTLSLGFDMNGGYDDATIVQDIKTVEKPMQKQFKTAVLGAPFPTFSSVRLGVSWLEDAGNANSTAPALSRVIIDYETKDVQTS